MLMNLLFGTYRQRILGMLLLHPESSYHVRELRHARQSYLASDTYLK
jgi:hypothetical protein